MASNSIPVILRVMAERDPGLADTLQQIERALAEMSRRAEQAGASAGGIDQGLEDAAQAARKVATSASGAAASVRKVADAEDNAATEADELAAAASRAETGLKGAERASGGLLAGLQKIGQQSALGAAMQALPTGSVVQGLPAAPVTAQEQQKRAVEALNQALEETEKQYDKTAKKAVELGQKSGMAMMAAGAGVAALLGYAVQVAGQFEQLRAKLETVQKSAIKAGETFEFARELAAKTPFDVQGVVAAAVQLEVYGTRAKEVLPLVADLAAGMGKRVEDTSLAFGKALSGSLEGWESLRNEYGISNTKLAQYGATLTATGGIAASTAGDLEKARTALQRIIQTEFGGAVERQSRTLQGALSNAGDSVQNLAATYGEALVPFVTGAASAFSSLVNAATSAPAPLRAVAVGVAAVGAGLLTMAGGTTIAVAGLVALNAQLLAAGPNIAAAGAAAKVTGGALGLLGTAAKGAGKAMAFLATNPFGLALIATVVGVGLATAALSSYEESQRKTGEALAEESRALQTAAQRWRTYRDAIQEASGESLEFGANVREIAATLDGLRDNPSALVAKFQERGFKLQDLQKGLQESRSRADELRGSIARILDAIDAVNRSEDPNRERLLTGRLRDMFPEKGLLDTVTLDDVQRKLAGLRTEFQQVVGTGDILAWGIKQWQRLEDPLSKAANEAARLNGYLKFAGKADDIRSMTEALGETQDALRKLQQQASTADPGLPVNDQGALQRRLLVPGLTDGQRDAIEAILTLMGEVESQSERINQANEKASSDRVRLMDQEFARAQAGRDEDLNATIAHLERKLQAVRGNAEQETQVINQLAQVRKQKRQEEIQGQRTALQDAVRAATEETGRLASSGDATAAQVAEGYRGVLVILDDWARAHQTLLGQVPELRKEYDRLRQGAQDQVVSAERTARDEKLTTLREQARELQAGARGQQEQLQATRQALDLYERTLRSSQDLRGNAESRKTLQREINDLRRSEADLVEQIAERERRSKQQTASLLEQLLDAEIATLEARLRAGEDVEAELQAKRAERFQAALDAIQAETDAEVKAAEGNQVLIEEALKRGLARRRLLQEQERQRLLSGLRQEVSAVKDAEDQKDRARKRFRPEDRIGGENSPIMTGEEAFADVLPGMKGLQLGNTPSILGAKKDEDDSRKQAADSLQKLDEAAQETGQSMAELPPVQAEFGAAATAGGVSLRELAAAASQAAASLSSIAGGGAGGGGEEALPPAPEGTTTDGERSYAPGYGPEGARPVSDGGYPTTGYPGLERRMPTPVEMGAVSPRVVMQAPVRTSSMSRSEVRQTVIVNGAASTEPQAQAVAREAARLVEQQQDRKRLMAGPWR